MADKLLDWLFGILARPVDTLRTVAEARPVGWAILIYSSITILAAVTSFYSLQAAGSWQEVNETFGLSIPLGLVIGGSIFLGLISLFIATGLLHLFARLFGGSGNYSGLLSAYGFAYFPMIISVPITVLAGFIGFIGGIVSGLAGLALSVWVFVLQVIALRESHRLSTGISILVYLIQFLILIVIPVAVGIALVAYFIIAG